MMIPPKLIMSKHAIYASHERVGATICEFKEALHSGMSVENGSLGVFIKVCLCVNTVTSFEPYHILPPD